MKQVSVFVLLGVVCFVFLLVGCNVAPAETTPTTDLYIVWSDDFNDGDVEGWRVGWGVVEIEDGEGELSFGDEGGYISHPSTISKGTWSADVFIPADMDGGSIIFNFMSKFMGQGDVNDDPIEWRNVGVTIDNRTATIIGLGYWDGYEVTMLRTRAIKEGEILTGWHHIDITRDGTGVVKVYFDNELVLEYDVVYSYEPNYFGYVFCCEGPAIDNLVVRNQVIEIRTPEVE